MRCDGLGGRCVQLEAKLADARGGGAVLGDGLRRLCAMYDERLKTSAGVAKIDLARPVRDIVYAAAHVRWMLSVMPEMDDPAKASRWLGFVQGVLFTIGAFSIDDLREHVTGAKA